ncbi:MAG: BamA/TamA family outer membrane protein [Melioribacteraceae bacterium]|nr:BamA/TamA family outer membrane protein [Melioribacteraceae bacterium]
MFLTKRILFFIFITSAVIFSQKKDTLKLDLETKRLPFELTQQVPINLPKVGLALSGGGARALSLLGILRVFEEEQIPIDIIVGTSMGSIVGGLYSAGYSINELDSLVRKTNWNDLFAVEQTNRNELFVDQKLTEDRAIISFRIDGLKPILPRSLSSGQRGANFLNLLSLNAPIQTDDYNNLRYKFRAIATDLVYGKKVVLDQGPLGISMQASSSVTLLLPPVKRDSLSLVDGGLVANIPVKETRKLGADIIIAGNAVSPLYEESELNYPWVIADQLVSIPMQILNEQQLEEADFIIQPRLNGIKNSDFNQVDSILTEGYRRASEQAASIKEKIKEQFIEYLDVKEEIYQNIFVKEFPKDLENSFLANIKSSDIISNHEILFQLYQIQKSGDYKNVFVEIEKNNSATFFSLHAKKNSEVTNYEITGVSIFDRENLARRLSHLINKPFNSLKTLNAALDILREYKESGYILARIESILFEESTGTLHIMLDEGLVSKLIVDGNTKTQEKIITREFAIKVGDYLRFVDAQKGLTNLRSTNLFEQIELTAEKSEEGNKLKITVIERPSSIMRFGMRIDNENYTQLSFDIRDENFLGTGTEVGTILSGGIRNRSYILEHRANRVFDTYFTYRIRAFYDFNDVNVYDDDPQTVHNKFSRSKTGEYRQIFYGGSFSLGSQVGRFGHISAEAKYQRDEIKGKYDYTGPSYNLDIASLRLSLIIDSQDQYPYPTDGFLVKTYYETAQTALGGDISYSKFLFDYKSILGLNAPNAFIFHGTVGISDETLPLSQHFSFGGQNMFFGYRDNEYRGRQVFSASLEYMQKLPIKLFFDTYLKFRYDLGSAWTEKEQIRYKDLRHGIGATLSFNTPVGPADFSVGKSFYLVDAIPKNKVIWGPTFFYFTIGYYY